MSDQEKAAQGGFVKPENVFLDVELASRDELLRFVSSRAVEAGIADDEEELFQAFLKREAEGPTGLVEGYAIPHAKAATVKDAAVVVVKAKEGIADWETMDGSPVTCAIALLVPDAEAGTTHLRLLAQTAQALIDDDFRRDLHAETDPVAIAGLVNVRLG